MVGVDGSPAADRALVWAVEEASSRGATLEVCALWHVPVSASSVPGFVDYDLFSEPARQAADKAVAGAREIDPALRVEVVTAEGFPAPRLIEESKGAVLLVVGSRGLGGFQGMVLGSVSRHCAEHSHCPLLIVRE